MTIAIRRTAGLTAGLRALAGPALAAPAALFLLLFFAVPLAAMLAFSVTSRVDGGVMVPAFGFENYARIFDKPLYIQFLLRTMRVALLTTLACALLSYPLALAIARGGRLQARLIMLVLTAPLLINLVIRSYGWTIVLSRQGLLNWALARLGIAPEGQVLYTEAAVVMGCVHLFLPFMVLPLTAAILRIDPSVSEAARVLGASAPRHFLHVTLPLSLPGLGAGATLVFSLTAGAYVTPQILGGNFSPLIGSLIEQQITTVNDWPFGAALATVLVAAILLVNLLYIGLVERRTTRWTQEGRR